MRRYLLLMLVIGAALVEAACGGGSLGSTTQSNVMQIKSGNWLLEGSSATGVIAPLHLGMGVSQSGSTLTVNLVPLSPCLLAAPPPVVQVSTAGNVFTLQATLGDATLHATLSGSSTLMIGNYSITGGCADGDHGTITATYVPPVTGTWTGTIQSFTTGVAGPQLTVNLAQSSASLFGFYTLTGTATVTGSTCMTTATVGSGTVVLSQPPASLPSNIAASTLSIYLNSSTNNNVNVLGTLDPPGYDKTMHAFIAGSSFAGSTSCPDMAGVAVLVKQ